MKTDEKGRGQKGVIAHIKLHYPLNNFTRRASYDGLRVGKLPRFGPISPAPKLGRPRFKILIMQRRVLVILHSHQIPHR
jgi:hypothetical protein